MQLLFDFFPLIVFFVAYRIYGIYVATVVLIVAMAAQIGYQWFRHRKVNKMLLVSGILVAVFGGITLALRNPIYLQWKVTIVNWLFAGAFLLSQFIGSKTLTERVMGHAIELEKSLWRQLNVIWVLNFLVLGAVNLYVMYNFSVQAWATFKVFGMVGLSLLTALGQALWIALKTSQSTSGTDRQTDRS
jgi:intracellular septation protein